MAGESEPPESSEPGERDPWDEDPEETWFDPVSLAEASSVHIGAAARRLLEGVHEAELLEAERERWINPGRLPGWPGAPDSGHGWGDALTRIVGGIQPGQLWVLESEEEGPFVRALLRQLADGFALRSAGPLDDDEPSTPAILLTREGRAETTRRSAARMTGEDLGLFRHGDRAGGFGPWGPADVDRARAAARAMLEGPLGRAREHLRVVPGEPPVRGLALVDLIQEALGGWAHRHPRVWPVLLVDDLERLAEPTDGGIEPFLARLRERAATAGWVVLGGTALGVAQRWADVRIEFSSARAPSSVQARVLRHREGTGGGGRVVFRHEPATGRCIPDE